LSTPASPQASTSAGALAPAWHTVVVVLILLAMSGLGAHSRGLPSVGHSRNRIASYVTVIVMEWVVVAFIWFGLRLRKRSVRALLGENWGGAKQILRDIGLAVLFLILANIILTGLGHLLKAAPNESVRNLLPHGRVQIGVYLLLSVTAGICEEIIFRGYLQRQFSALLKSTAGAVILQGIIFGASHGYQGPTFMLIIVVYGVLFGMLAQWRRSLRPGMIAHFVQDFSTGVLAGRYLK
jgi:membrane protease YdiL (CAAX protease family)